MRPQISALILAGGLAFGAPGGALAQRAIPPANVPTTHILAIGTIVPGADLQKVQATLPSEVRATVQLELDGKIDQWFSQTDRRGVVFILNVTDPTVARQMLEALPLGQAKLMTFELIPLGPLAPLRQLLAPPSPPR